MDDEDVDGFAPKRRWYQVHVTALILALVGVGAGMAFTPAFIGAGLSLALAGIAGIASGRTLLRPPPVDKWVPEPYDIDGVPVEGVRAPLMLIALIPMGVFVALGGAISMLSP